MPKESYVVCEATMVSSLRIVTVKYPESVCFCRIADAIALFMVNEVEPVPLLVSEPPIVPDHLVSDSILTVKVASDSPA